MNELHFMDNSELVKRYFIRLIQGTTSQTSSRHLTVETINRYIFTLNALHDSERGHIAEVKVREKIKEVLEKKKIYNMDKKTLRRIIENLRKEELLQTRKFKVTMEEDLKCTKGHSHKDKKHPWNKANSDDDYSSCDEEEPSIDSEKQYTQNKPQVKTLLLTPFCNLTDEELINENSALNNPTRLKPKQPQSPSKNTTDLLFGAADNQGSSGMITRSLRKAQELFSE